jgi:hypothetical protein
MRTAKVIIVACAALLAAAALSAEDGPRVTYQLLEPSAFKDFEIRDVGVDETAKVFDEQFSKHVVPAVEKALPQGQRLSIRILEFDMAGEIQPLRNSRFEPVRYVEWGFPPRITLEYQLIDVSGGVLAEGREELVDKSFDTRPATRHRDRPFAFETDMLQRWAVHMLSLRQAGVGR